MNDILKEVFDLKRSALILILLLCTLLLTACYQEVDPWPDAPSSTLAPTATPVPTQVPQSTAVPTQAPTEPPQTQSGLNG